MSSEVVPVPDSGLPGAGPVTSGKPTKAPLHERSGFIAFVQRILPLAPAVIMLVLFLAGPIIWALISSFTNAALTGPAALNPQFVGLANYQKMFADPVFLRSIFITVVFVLVSAVFGQNILGMALALMMRAAHGTMATLVGTIVVAAWVLPEIVAAFAMYAFFVDGGTLNQVLGLFRINGANWLFNWPMFAIILANIWRGTAFSMMVYRAALDDVPPEVTEAAEIDGASGAKRLFLVTLPMIRKSIGTNMMLITLQTLSVFTLVFVMTGGGPANASMTLPVYAYEQAFRFFDVGYGSAIAMVMIVVGALFAVFYVRLLRSEEE